MHFFVYGLSLTHSSPRSQDDLRIMTLRSISRKINRDFYVIHRIRRLWSHTWVNTKNHLKVNVLRAASPGMASCFARHAGSASPADTRALRHLHSLLVIASLRAGRMPLSVVTVLWCIYAAFILDEEYYRYKVVPTIKELGPWWQKFDIFESIGRRPSFDAEIKRLLSENR